MDLTDILARIDSQIAALRMARAALTAVTDSPAAVPTPKKKKKKSKFSAEARQMIAEAQRKRWAAQKKAAK